MRKEKGFTLIELMIVVAIIGILAAIAIPRFAQLIDKAREAGARGNLGALRSAIAIYYGDNRGVWPVSLDNTGTHELYGHTLPAFVKAYMGKIPKATLQRGISDHNDKDTVRYVQTQAHDEIDATGINDAGGWVYSSRSGDCRINCNHRDTSPYTTLYYSNYGHEEP